MSHYHFKLALDPAEIAAYYALRRQIFVAEQQLFSDCDRDELDQIAYPIVAVASETAQVVGVVRIYEASPGVWYGGRLGTHPDFRRGWTIGRGLIVKAVTTAHAWGCDRFLATVQIQNVRFFERLHWHSLDCLELNGLEHHLMQADLAHYPPAHERRYAIAS